MGWHCSRCFHVSPLDLRCAGGEPRSLQATALTSPPHARVQHKLVYYYFSCLPRLLPAAAPAVTPCTFPRPSDTTRGLWSYTFKWSRHSLRQAISPPLGASAMRAREGISHSPLAALDGFAGILRIRLGACSRRHRPQCVVGRPRGVERRGLARQGWVRRLLACCCHRGWCRAFFFAPEGRRARMCPASLVQFGWHHHDHGRVLKRQHGTAFHSMSHSVPLSAGSSAWSQAAGVRLRMTYLQLPSNIRREDSRLVPGTQRHRTGQPAHQQQQD
jgi:hypothetical protein